MDNNRNIKLNGLKDFIFHMMKEWNIPGTVITIIKDEKVIFREGFGYRNIEEKLPVTQNTVFPIASVTKSFTSAALAILADRGKLNWDKPIREYIPELTLGDLYISENVTTRDILSHRTGLPAHNAIMELPDYTRNLLPKRLKYMELSREFRTAWQYNNHMYVLAGHLVERLSEKKWERFVTDEILEPLEMDNTCFDIKNVKSLSDFALPYVERNSEIEKMEFYKISEAGPAGSMNSNILDLEKWLMFQLNSGKVSEKQLISLNNLGEMHKPQAIINEGFPYKFKETPYATYGLGWFILPYRGYQHIYHGGVIDGFGSLLAFLPEENIGVAIISNKDGAGLFNRVIKYSIFDRLLNLEHIDWNERFKLLDLKSKTKIKGLNQKNYSEKKKNTSPSHNLNNYVGDYHHPSYSKVSIILNSEGKLCLEYLKKVTVLEHYHYDVFIPTFDESSAKTVPLPIKFNTSTSGIIESLSIPLEPSVKDITFNRVKMEELTC